MNSKKNHLFIVWLNGIGDFVMAIPALCEFQKTNNFTEITILCRNDMSSILSKTTIFQEIPIRQIITNKKTSLRHSFIL